MADLFSLSQPQMGRIEGASDRREPSKKGRFPDVLGARRACVNSKLHVASDGAARPTRHAVNEGQMSDCNGAALMLPALTQGQGTPRRQRGYDADWFRAAIAGRGITACILIHVSIPYDPVLYRQRYKIENMPRRIKD